ncbi:MAG: hypothetical protein ACPGPE_04145, partial [Planctomycetota bacterium]
MRHTLRLPQRLALLGTVFAVGSGVVVGRPAAQEGTLFTGATVFAGFDGRRAEALGRPDRGAAILVVGGRIVGIGGEGELASTDAG